VDNRPAMSTIKFERFSDRFPPERELLHIEDDGSFEMWRSYGAPAAGRFAGAVPDSPGLQDLARATRRSRPPSLGELEPDASVENLAVGNRRAEAESGSRIAGPWGELFARCRSLLRDLVDQPRAAIRATIDPSGVVRLEHQGTEPLPVELAPLEIKLVRWADAREAASDRVRPEAYGRIDAAPGWSLEIPFNPSVMGPGQVVASVTFVAIDNGVLVPVAISARHGQP